MLSVFEQMRCFSQAKKKNPMRKIKNIFNAKKKNERKRDRYSVNMGENTTTDNFGEKKSIT